MYIAKITRTYAIKGQIIQLIEGKEVEAEIVKQFSDEAQKKYFEQTTVKATKKSKSDSEIAE